MKFSLLPVGCAANIIPYPGGMRTLYIFAAGKFKTDSVFTCEDVKKTYYLFPQRKSVADP
jgi:hypothetical protein